MDERVVASLVGKGKISESQAKAIKRVEAGLGETIRRGIDAGLYSKAQLQQLSSRQLVELDTVKAKKLIKEIPTIVAELSRFNQAYEVFLSTTSDLHPTFADLDLYDPDVQVAFNEGRCPIELLFILSGKIQVLNIRIPSAWLKILTSRNYHTFCAEHPERNFFGLLSLYPLEQRDALCLQDNYNTGNLLREQEMRLYRNAFPGIQYATESLMKLFNLNHMGILGSRVRDLASCYDRELAKVFISDNALRALNAGRLNLKEDTSRVMIMGAEELSLLISDDGLRTLSVFNMTVNEYRLAVRRVGLHLLSDLVNPQLLEMQADELCRLALLAAKDTKMITTGKNKLRTELENYLGISVATDPSYELKLQMVLNLLSPLQNTGSSFTTMGKEPNGFLQSWRKLFDFLTMLAEIKKQETLRVQRFVTMLKLDDIAHQYVNYLFTHPVATQNLAKQLKLTRIEIGDGGRSKFTWLIWLRGFLTNIHNSDLPGDTAFSNGLREAWAEKVDIEAKSFRTVIDFNDWQPYAILGRTLLFKPKGVASPQRLLAVKGHKKGKSPVELTRQYSTVRYYRKQTHLKFPYPLPDPIAVVKLLDVDELILQFSDDDHLHVFESLAAIDEDNTMLSYVYEADIRYFRYIYMAKDDDEYFSGLSICSETIFSQLQHNVITDSIADVFHTRSKRLGTERDDGGTYLALANLFTGGTEDYGCGSLESWEDSVATTDMRVISPADEADVSILSDTIKQGRVQLAPHEQLAFKYLPNKAWIVLLMNKMAEYLLTMELTTGRYLIEQKTKDWLPAVKKLFQVYAIAYAAYTGMPKHHALRFLSQLFDVEQYARQMRLWMSTDYIKPVEAKTIPDGIYNKDVKVEFLPFREGTWHSKIGFSHNATSDTPTQSQGPTNGQYLIKQGEKFRHLFAPLAVIQRSSFAKVKPELDDVIACYKTRLSQIIHLLKQEANNSVTKALIIKLILRRAFPLTERFLTIKELMARANLSISTELSEKIARQLDMTYDDAQDITSKINKITKYLPYYRANMLYISL